MDLKKNLNKYLLKKNDFKYLIYLPHLIIQTIECVFSHEHFLKRLSKEKSTS